MRRYNVLMLVITLALFFPVAAFANGVWQTVNHSADYVKTQSRNASTDLDSVYYNPAGTALMAEGLYFSFSDQFIYAPVSIDSPSLTRNSYKGFQMAYLFPDIFLDYTMKAGPGKFAWSFGILFVGGGGGGTYKKGLQLVDAGFYVLSGLINSYYTLIGVPAQLQLQPGAILTSKFVASVGMPAAQTNFAYSVLDDRLAFSIGYRFIYAFGSTDANFKQNGIPIAVGGDYHSTQKGTAHSIIFGISAKPIDALTLGFRAEYSTPLRMKTKAHDDWLVLLLDMSMKDGGVAHRQLPPMFGFGISYRVSGVQLSASSNVYLNQYAQWNGKEKNHVTGYDLSCGVDYTFAQVPINIGIGYTWNFMGSRASVRSQTNESLDHHDIGGGISYTFKNNLKLTVAYIFLYYVPLNVNKGYSMVNLPVNLFPGDFNKQAHQAGIGVEYKIL
ncbi:MAG: hypothetical protein JXA07_03370 [Spirochaetes bacterium]|nr:hypothetical protein [Spirochaetota bacterium]